MNLQWFHVDNPPGFTRPRWMRQAALADDGTVFAPATLGCPNEGAVVMAASWHSVPMVYDKMHAYLPTAWLAREFPEVADVCRLIEEKVNGAKGAP